MTTSVSPLSLPDAISLSGLDRQDIAERAGVVPSTISKWCDSATYGARVPNILEFDALCGAMELSPSQCDRLADWFRVRRDAAKGVSP